MHIIPEEFIDKKDTPPVFRSKNIRSSSDGAIYYLNHLTAVLNKLLMIRDAADILIQNEVNIANINKPRNVNLLNGNLGLISFSPDDSVFYGLNTLAGSFKVQKSISDALDLFNDTTINLSSDKDGNVAVERVVQGKSIFHTFPAIFKSKKTHDSEYLLLNYISQVLDQSSLENGKVLLITERLPCKHCLQVIIDFNEKYPNIEIHLMFLHLSGVNPLSKRKYNKQNTPPKNIDEDIENLLSKINDNIKVYKSDFSVTVNTIPISLKSDDYYEHTISDRIIEQHRKFNMDVSPDTLRHLKSKK